ncbi:MAG TPA: hypothetical protein VIA63_09125 [Candidatus Limnocylindria bacterium]
MTKGNRIRLGLVAGLAAAILLTSCGGAGANGTVCPAPTLEPLTTPAAAGGPITYGFLIDRAYTGDAKRSPSYPWPQLPMTALNTVAGALTKLDLRPGDSVFGTWISHNSNDMREIYLPLTQVPKSSTAEYPTAPTPPKAPLNQLECNDYAAKVRTYNTAAKDWQAKVNDIAQRSAADDAAAVASFIERTQAAIGTVAPVQDPVGTDIYGSLAVAGGVFGANPGKHKLVLFSDMTDTIGNPVRPDLAQSDIVVGLYHRDDPSDQGKGQRDWESTFKTLNARTPVFLPWAATTVDKIVEQLRASGR